MLFGLAWLPLGLLVVERVVASEHVGAVELVAGHSAGHSGADVAVAGVAEPQLVAVAAVAGERELVLVVLAPAGPDVVPVFVHSDGFVAGLVAGLVGGRVG